MLANSTQTKSGYMNFSSRYGTLIHLLKRDKGNVVVLLCKDSSHVNHF